MSQFGLKFSQMILHTQTNKLMYNWSFLFEVLHKPTLLPSTFNLLFMYIKSELLSSMNAFQQIQVLYSFYTQTSVYKNAVICCGYNFPDAFL